MEIYDLDKVLDTFDIFNINGMIDACSVTTDSIKKMNCARTVIEQIPIGIISLAGIFMKKKCESILGLQGVIDDKIKTSENEKSKSLLYGCVLIYSDVKFNGQMIKYCSNKDVKMWDLRSFTAKSFISHGIHGIFFARDFGRGRMMPFGPGDEEKDFYDRKTTDKCGIPHNEKYYEMNSLLIIENNRDYSETCCFVFDFYDKNGFLYNRLLPYGEFIYQNPINLEVDHVDLIITSRATLKIDFPRNVNNKLLEKASK